MTFLKYCDTNAFYFNSKLFLSLFSFSACSDDCLHDPVLQNRIKTGLMSHLQLEYLSDDSSGLLRMRWIICDNITVTFSTISNCIKQYDITNPSGRPQTKYIQTVKPKHDCKHEFWEIPLYCSYVKMSCFSCFDA